MLQEIFSPAARRYINQYINGIMNKLTNVPMNIAPIMAMESGFCNSDPMSNENSNGTMATGWRRDGNKWYYLMPDNKESGYEKGQMFSSGTKDIEVSDVMMMGRSLLRPAS